MQRKYLAVVISWLAMTGTLAAATTTLDFNAPVPGTLTDANGLGTGFTTRLPGTGSAIPVNDPSLNLNSRPGYLQVTAANGIIGGVSGGTNLPIADAPALLLPGVNNQDLTLVAKFDDVDVPDYQFATYVGVRSDLSIRFGFHGPYQYYMAANDGTGGDFGWSSGPNAFAPGDDIILTVERQNGLWSVSWNNLTNPLNSGSSISSGIGTGNLPFPLLNAEPDLYAGVIEFSATPHVGSVDYFQVTTVPEPSAVVLLGFGGLGLFIAARRRRSSGRTVRADVVQVR